MNLHSLKNKSLVYAALTSFLLSSTIVHGECSIEDSPADLNFTLQDVAGEDVLLSDYLGKVIILDFWATWCAPCRIEIPGFIDLLDQYEPQGFAVFSLPKPLHKKFRTSNLIERFNQELKRRSKSIRIFPNENSCLRLLSSLALEFHEEWLDERRLFSADDLLI